MTPCEHEHECNPSEMLRYIREAAEGVTVIKVDVAVIKTQMEAMRPHEERISALERWRSGIVAAIAAVSGLGGAGAWFGGLFGGPK